MPVLPAPAEPVLGAVVPVEACSCKHFARSSPIRVSQRPLLGPIGAAL
jgi:hypothetical protein